jgi:hypothetical protein
MRVLQATVHQLKVLRYLGRYVHRIVIANSRIESMDDGKVTFRYQESSTGEQKRMPLPSKEFLRRYLQHVLPSGFHKVRYYGSLRPANRVTLKRVQLLLAQRSRRSRTKSTELHLKRRRPGVSAPAARKEAW